MNSPHAIDSRLVSYYVKKSNSLPSPTAVGDIRSVLDETAVSPDQVADIAKDFLSKVLGGAINHFEYREDGLLCGATDLQFALESMAREHLRKQDDIMEEAEDDGNDDDDYVPEETTDEPEEEAEEANLASDDDEDNGDDEDEDFQPQPDEEIDADAGDDVDNIMDSEENSDQNQGFTPGAGQDSCGDSCDWALLFERQTPLFCALFPVTSGRAEGGLRMTQFQALWEEACSEVNSSIEICEPSYCHEVIGVALNAYLAKVLPEVGASLSGLHEEMESDDTSSDVWRIAQPFVRGVMKVALIHMEHCSRMTCNIADFRFALDFIAREQMHSQVLNLLETEENNSFSTPLFNSIFPAISDDDMNNDEEYYGGFSFLQIQDLWAEALRERGVTSTGMLMRSIDVSLYRPLRRALDSYIVASIHPGDLEPRQLDKDLSKLL